MQFEVEVLQCAQAPSRLLRSLIYQHSTIVIHVIQLFCLVIRSMLYAILYAIFIFTVCSIVFKNKIYVVQIGKFSINFTSHTYAHVNTNTIAIIVPLVDTIIIVQYTVQCN